MCLSALCELLIVSFMASLASSRFACESKFLFSNLRFFCFNVYLLFSFLLSRSYHSHKTGSNNHHSFCRIYTYVFSFSLIHLFTLTGNFSGSLTGSSFGLTIGSTLKILLGSPICVILPIPFPKYIRHNLLMVLHNNMLFH